jgi:thiopurine S-methyltransferase
MDPDFWHERWRTNQIGFHQGDVNSFLVRYWKSLALNEGGRILVPLCGKSRDMFWLLEQGYAVVGVEISPLAVEAFFAENRLTPVIIREARGVRWKTKDLEILCGDFFELERGDIGVCQGVYDRAALIALPPPMRARYVKHLSTLLERHVRGLLLTMDYNQSEMDGPPFSVSDAEVSRLFADTCTVQQLSSTDILHSQPRFLERGLTRLSEQAWRMEWTGQATNATTPATGEKQTNDSHEEQQEDFANQISHPTIHRMNPLRSSRYPD